MLNTLFMAAEAQYIGIDNGHKLGYRGSVNTAAEAWPHAKDIFAVTEYLFLAIFTLEVTVKIAVMKRDFFKDLWNVFDMVIVACGLLEASLQGELPLDPSLLRLARLTRLLRMLRLVRTIQSFDSLYIMTTSIKGSLSVLLWSTILMFVVQMLIALILSTLLETYLLDGSKPEAERHAVYSYFGTFTKGMLTMFEITLANWIPVCRALAEHVSEWYVIFALIHKFIIGFAVVMVITGVFLQETFKVASTDDTIMMNQKQRAIKTHTKKMSVLFKAADEDGNGMLEREEFCAMMKDDHVVTWLSSMGLEVADADTLFTMVAKESENGEAITAVEFVKGVARLKGNAKSIDMAVMMHENRQLMAQVQKLQSEFSELKMLHRSCPAAPEAGSPSSAREGARAGQPGPERPADQL